MVGSRVRAEGVLDFRVRDTGLQVFVIPGLVLIKVLALAVLMTVNFAVCVESRGTYVLNSRLETCPLVEDTVGLRVEVELRVLPVILGATVDARHILVCPRTLR